MANLRSFTGFLALDVLGTQNVAPGLSFTFPGSNPLDIIIQDGDGLLQGDSAVNDQSADPEGDQIGFVTNSDGEALLDGQEIFVETSFTFTLDGAGSFTGYILENEGSGQSFVVLPPNLAAGTVAITATDDAATNIDYALLGSGDEEVSQNDFSNLDVSGSDTITGGDGADTIDAGEGDDSILAGAGGDTVFGNAGGDTVDGGAGDDSIRGDSGEDGIATVRESFNWAELGLNNGDAIPNNVNGIDQDTGNITVNFDYSELARFDAIEYRNTFAQNTDGIDTGGETIGNDIGFLVGDGTSAPGDTTEVIFGFSANTAGFEDEVRNVQFRINDVDDLNWRDIVEVTAFDANGDPVHVVLTGGSNITLTDTDGVNGLDTAIANNTNTNNQPIDASNSLFIEIPGPVASINIVYGNLETGGQRVDVTDIFFDAVPTAIANVETGDDSLLGGAGDDTIFGEAGEDTIDGGTDDDSVEGGAGDDLLVINDNFGNDTITGGEIGETTGDTLDGGALTEAVNVVYSGDEAGDALNSVTGDSAEFSEIEHINTGSGDDTIDGTLDTVGIDLNAGAGADTILGGQAGDTLNAGSGDDTIDGQAGVDTISAGDGDDEIQLTDGFDNDSIIGGEGGETTGDTVSGATLTEDVVVTYDGDESGNFVGQTSGDNAAFDEIEGVTTGSGDDTVDASADSTGQIITTNAGTDTILGGQGGDTIDAGADDDTVDGGAGSDSIAGGGGEDGILGGAGADTIAGGTGNDTIDGGAEADSINGGDDQDLINLTGNFGDDTIAGGEGGTDGDTLDGGTLTEDINVLFDGDESGNFTGQTTGSDAQFSEIEAINTGSGDDTVDASADSVGTTINTGAGTDTVLGGAGGDTLTTGTGDDTVDGGAGADSINAGDGDDELRLNDGFGDDTIIAGEGGETNGDTLAGGGLTEDVTVTFANDEDGTVTNDGGDSASFIEVERVETGSGEDTIDATASTGGVDVDSGEGDDTITGGSGSDTLASAGGADTINAGAGDDSITAGDGDDVIQLTPGYDNDTIVGGEGGETNGDTLDGSTLAEDVVVTYDGDEQGDFVGQNTGDDADFAEIEAINTGSGDDTIDASADNVGINVQTNAGDDSVIGGGGDDLISTGDNADTVDGGLGADTITAGDGDDLINLTGNFGDDSIVGGEGGETNGDTLDGSTLAENVNVTFNGDEAGNFTGAATGSDATFEEIEAIETGSGDDTVDASADTVGVNVSTNGGVDTVLGGTGDDTLAAGAGDDTVDGGLGADSVTGGDGDDELRINDQFGNDTIVGGEGGETNGDTLAGGGLTEDVNVTFADDESGTVTNPGGDNAGFSEIEAVETGSGDDTIDATASTGGVNVDSGAGDDTITGGTGDDTFAAGEGDDTIAAGEGADSITAGDGDDDIQLTDNFGNDTIVGGEGGETDGDEIDASAVTEPVTVLFDGDEQGTITGDNTGDQANFEEIEEITTGSGDDTVDATADTVGTTINTGAGDDTVLGGQGGDTLNTGTGQDTVNGGAGADSINAGDDEDTIQLTDGFGDDTIAGGEGGTDADTLDGGALTENVDVTVNADGESGTVTNPGGDNATFTEIEAINTGSGDDTVDASAANVGVNVDTGAGEDTVTGGTGDDTLAAGAGDDTVDGGLGDDSITGGDGDDELQINDQFGNDTIVGGEGGETNGDTLAGGGLTEDVTVTFNADGESGTVTNPGGDTATFSEIEAVETGSGDDTVDASGSPVGVNVDSGAGSDSITGGTGDDTFLAGAGNDAINAGEGADSINAGDDLDTITLTGNFGDDTIVGGEGGVDADVVSGSGLTEDVVVTFSGDEAGSFVGQTSGSDATFSEIEAIITGSGDDTIDATNDTVGTTLSTGAGDDSVLGGAGGDGIGTGAGADTVNGAGGDDTISTGDGDDVIQLTDGFGDDSITAGEGAETNGDRLDGSALTEAVTVTFNADDESGTVTNPGGDTASFAEVEAVATGEGDDTIDGSGSTGGIDVDAGAGADTITGGAGGDTLAAGEGADTVDGGLGADSITGGGGDDELRISDMFGDDTIVGGETGETNGDTLAGGGLTENVEVIFNADGESGTVTNPGGDTANFAEIEAVETGSGDDTIDATGSPVGVNANAGAGDDTITGGTGDDTLAGGAGVDTIDGGAGADSIDGGADEDSLLGGAGNDTIVGGDGADTIDGGEDNDLLSGGDEDDLFIYMAGQGDDTISDFNFGNTGALGDGDPTNNDFIDLTDFYTNLTEARADIADDGILNQSVGDFGDNTLLDGSLTLAGVTPGGLTTDNTGLANEAGDFPHIVQGADGGAGVNQDGDNIFDDGRFYVEFIDNTGPTANLADLGFDTLDGSLGTAEVYNAGTTDDLDITNQTGTFGNDETEFGARITTTLDVAVGGTYTFSTTSDDGSILFINGTQVVNNDGLHASQTASGTIDLDPGQFEVTILYFENAGVENLSATISGPDTGNTPLSLNDPAVNVRANAGAETVSGGAGDDTFQAGEGDDVLFGDEDQDLFVMTNGFDSDTITGGEGGTDSDSIDGSPLSSAVNVVYSGDEAGTFSDPFDTAVFSEIENLTLTAQDDTLDATNDTVGVNVLAGAGDDSLLGGTGGDTISGEAGQDTLAGEAGADSLSGGDDQDTFIVNDQFGDDTIAGGEGGTDQDDLQGSALTEDVTVTYGVDGESGTVTNPGGDAAQFSEIERVFTGSGEDTIDASGATGPINVSTGAGEDTITGGAGDDVINAGDGDDTIDGGEGVDVVVGGDGDDLIQLSGVFGDGVNVGGEGGETTGDTLSGATLTEDVAVTFSGDEAGNFVSQDGNGNATFAQIEAVETGLGDDTVDATLDTTGVTIITNEGDDVIIGGAGDDSIDAGDDDDTITFGQNDTVLGGAGADEFIIQPTTGGMGVIGDFDPSTNVDNTVIYDPLNPPDQDDNDFVDLSSFFANINELRDANVPNGDGDVVLDLGDGQTLTFVGVSDVTLLNFENTNVICFTRGAKIRTANGDIPVEDLREGDMVETMDSGAQPIRWIGRRVISAGILDTTPRLRPVRIAKGALGASRDLMVSPQHRMLLSGERAEMMFGTDQVLASAKDLIDGDMIHMGPAEDVEYFHILFDDHEIIFAEDVPTESFHPGEQALNTTTAKMQAEIFELFPELAEEVVTRPTARMVLKSHEAKAFVR